MPEIQLADTVKPDPAKRPAKPSSSRTCRIPSPRETPVRGKKLFHDAAKSLCITCHVKGDKGCDFRTRPDADGAIRSERDLLEAIIYLVPPSPDTMSF